MEKGWVGLSWMQGCLGEGSEADATKTDEVRPTASGESLMSPLPLVQPLDHDSITHVTFPVVRCVESPHDMLCLVMHHINVWLFSWTSVLCYAIMSLT